MKFCSKILPIFVFFFFNLSLEAQYVEYGEAAYYNDNLHGRPTSSGEIYDKNKLTCAHKTLPTGSIIKVTRLDNGKSVRVKVNDCGPHSKGRVVDLSRAAAERINLIWTGIAEVKIELVSRATGKSPCGDRYAIPAAYADNTRLPAGTTAKGGGVVIAPPPQSGAPIIGNGTYRVELLRPIRLGYGVQVASYSKYENAVNRAGELQAKGFKNVLVNINSFTNKFRVVIGPFDNEQSAKKYQDNLKKNYKMKGFVVDLSGI